MMEESSSNHGDRNSTSPSSTASGGSGSVRDVAKLLAMSVFSRAKKRKLDQIPDSINDKSLNSNDSLSTALQPPLLSKPGSEVPEVSESLSISKINSAPSLTTHLKNDRDNRAHHATKQSDLEGENLTRSSPARNSPILNSLLGPSSCCAVTSSYSQPMNPSQQQDTKILKTLLRPESFLLSKASSQSALCTNIQRSPTKNISKTSLTSSKDKGKCLQNNAKSSHLSSSVPITAVSLKMKTPESVSLRFLCCFSTLVFKPPSPRDIKKSLKSDEQYISYVCYAFDKGTLMCNHGAPTENIKNTLLLSSQTQGTIPASFLYDDSSLKRRSYSRFIISMKTCGWEVNVPKPGTAREVLQHIRSHEAFFLPDQGLSKVMSYVRQNYNGLLIKETIPMIEGELKRPPRLVSNLRPYDLYKIGEGKDYYLLRSCSIKKQSGHGIISTTSQASYTSNTSASRTLQMSTVAPYTQSTASPRPISTQSSNNPSENIQITLLPDPNQRQQSETLFLPSMGGGTITLHSASSEVVDTSFNSSTVQASAKTVYNTAPRQDPKHRQTSNISPKMPLISQFSSNRFLD